MGGDLGDIFSVQQNFAQANLPSGEFHDDDKRANDNYGFGFGEFEEVGDRVVEANLRKKFKAFREVLRSYDQLRSRVESLNEAKSKILSYTPGEWMEKVGGMKSSDCNNVPKTTTLLLVGPQGSGKSSLVNRISKVFGDDKFAPERAQVSYNCSTRRQGTYFLQEYMIPKGSSSFCLYDTRGLSDNTCDNIEMLKRWMTKGVRHGELIIRPSDNSSLRTRMMCKVRNNDSLAKESRVINFVIFIVSGLEALKCIGSKVEGENHYAEMIAATFGSPYLSFKDDKPVVVVTHGDLLSLSERARVRVWLGELLGIPPAKQIFDIPESCDPVTELSIVDMLRYALEHADKNLQQKYLVTEKIRLLQHLRFNVLQNSQVQQRLTHKVHRRSLSACLHLFVILGIAIISINIQWMHEHHEPEPEVHLDWHSMRHLWLE